MDTEDAPKELSVKDKRLEALAKGRAKMFENRKIKSEILKTEKLMAIEEKQKKLEERKKKVEDFKASKQPVEPVQEKKKKKQVVAEVSDSSEDEEDSESGSDSDSSVEIIVKRKPKGKVTKKTVKKTSKTQAQKLYHTREDEQEVSAMTTELAKKLLRDKLEKDNYNIAMRSLFPMHNF